MKCTAHSKILYFGSRFVDSKRTHTDIGRQAHNSATVIYNVKRIHLNIWQRIQDCRLFQIFILLTTAFFRVWIHQADWLSINRWPPYTFQSQLTTQWYWLLSLIRFDCVSFLIIGAMSYTICLVKWVSRWITECWNDSSDEFNILHSFYLCVCIQFFGV